MKYFSATIIAIPLFKSNKHIAMGTDQFPGIYRGNLPPILILQRKKEKRIIALTKKGARLMAYHGCIFDLDGTLANTLDSIAYFGNGTLAAFGLPPIPAEEYKLLVGNGADKLMERMLRRVGAAFSDEKLKKFRAEYDRRYESEPMKLVTPYPGLMELLNSLKAQGFLLGVLSNKPDNMTRYIVGELYGGLLDEVRGQREGVPKKPDPTAVLDIAKGFGLAPREILYVGDSGVDMETGKNAGMDPCGVLWGFRDREELLSHGAKYLAANAAELEKIAIPI